MPVQFHFRPKHLTLAITLAMGCADLSMAQDTPPDTQAISPAPTETFKSAINAFANHPDTVQLKVSKAYPAQEGVALALDGRNDLVTVQSRGSFAGLVDGGGGDNLLQLDANKKGVLGETRNFSGLEVRRGSWTRSGPGDFNIGVLVHPKAMLVNDGQILGTAVTEGILINKGAINGGATVAAGGDLTNQGLIDGTVDVHENAHIAGNGAVNHLNLHGRMTVDDVYGAPKIAGDLRLARSAVLAYAVDASGNSQTVVVKGTAHLGDATLKLVTAGDYPQSSQHTVLQAEQIEGQFGTVENDLAYMTPTLHYEAQRVGLLYARNDVPLEKLATTQSSQALAQSIDETPSPSQQPQQPQQPQEPETLRQTSKAISAATPQNTAVTALLGSSKPTASLALEQLAAGSNANLAKATLSSVNPLSASMLSAMHQLDSGNGAQSSGNAPRRAAGGEGNGRVWLQALGHGGQVDRDAASVLKHSTQGLVMGSDWRIDEQWHVGLMGAKAQTRFDARQYDGDLDSWHLGAYALRQDGPLALRLGASYGSHDGSGKRRVAFKGFSDRLNSSYDASTQHAFAEVGYNLGRGNVSIEPFASVGYQRYQRDGYTEKGGDAALKVQGQTQANPSSTLGLRLANTNQLSNGMQLTPHLSASVKHTYGDLDNVTRQQLVKGGRNFEVTGAGMDRNSFTLDAGLDLTLSDRNTLGIGLSGEAGNDSRSYGVTGQWRMAF